MNMTQQVRQIWKPLVFLLCLVPALLIVTDLLTDNLGSNKIEAIQDRFGIWALRFIMITLAMTPLRQVSKRNWIGLFRRMLGLFAFFYVLMHFLTWLILDQELNATAIADDIVKRPFITIGFIAFLLLVVMAATSTNNIRRKLGGRWQLIHNSVYAVGTLGVWHYWWQVKKDISEPLIYAIVLVVLLGYRVWRKKR